MILVACSAGIALLVLLALIGLVFACVAGAILIHNLFFSKGEFRRR